MGVKTIMNNSGNKVFVFPKDNFVRFMQFLDVILTNVEEFITITFLVVMVVSILVGIIMRFIFKIPNMYGEEVSRYSMVIVAFIGISKGVRQKTHLGIDVIVNNLPVKISKLVRIIADIMCIFAYGLFTIQSYKFVIQAKRMGQVSPGMRLPMWIVYCILLFGFSLSFIRSLMMLWNDYLAKKDSKLLINEIHDSKLDFQ